MKRNSVRIEFDVLTQGWTVIWIDSDIAVARAIYMNLDSALKDCKDWLLLD